MTGWLYKDNPRLYGHSRRLCNGRFDSDSVFPDKGISIQKCGWRASRESFTGDELVSIRRGGSKHAAHGIRRCYHPDEDGDGWNSPQVYTQMSTTSSLLTTNLYQKMMPEKNYCAFTDLNIPEICGSSKVFELQQHC